MKNRLIEVMTDYEHCSYITPGKWYRAIADQDGDGFCSASDNGEIFYSSNQECCHIGGNKWNVREGWK